ncbi:MAG: 30S ribosomal protein S17 [Candidatus Aenigmatarchaeota archaeon]
MPARNIGLDAKPPEKECNDEKCPWHGKLPVRKKVFIGKVVSARPFKTVVVEREYLHYIPKYERYERRKSKLYAHNPDCISAREGDIVKIAECRKLSKLKAFVVIEKI